MIYGDTRRIYNTGARIRDACWSQALLSLAGTLRFVVIPKHLGRHADQANDSGQDEEVEQHAPSLVVFLDADRPLRAPPSAPYMLIHIIMRLFVPLVVKVRHAIAMLLLARPIAAMLSIALRPRLLSRLSLVRIAVRILGPLGAVLAIAPRLVEARRRPAKRAPLLVQPAGRPRAKRRGAVAALWVCAAAAPRAVLRCGRERRVVLGALLGDGEHVVGLADGDEAGRRVRVVLVAVRVVFLRQRVELALDLGGRGGRAQLQRVVVRGRAGGAEARGAVEGGGGRWAPRGRGGRALQAGVAGPWRGEAGERAAQEGEGRAGWHCPCGWGVEGVEGVGREGGRFQ